MERGSSSLANTTDLDEMYILNTTLVSWSTRNGCVPLPDIITGMDYRNGHYAMTLGALNVF